MTVGHSARRETGADRTAGQIGAGRRGGTLCGFGAILIWSTTVALARSLSEQVGPLTAAAAVYGVSGALALGRLALVGGAWRESCGLPRRYLLGCGGLFVLYMLVFYLAVGLAESRLQVLEVALLNYLWPTLTILFALPLLGHRGSWLLLPGSALALSGIVLVLTQGAEVSWRSFAGNLAGNPAAYGLGALAGVSWALYSTLTRRWAGGEHAGGADLFLPASGVVLGLLAWSVDEPRAWGHHALGEAGLLGIATYLAYGLWDRAMRTGQVVLVATGSYLTPLLSTLVSCLYLAVAPAPSLWAGSGLLVAGAVLSWWSVAEGPMGPGLRRRPADRAPLRD